MPAQAPVSYGLLPPSKKKSLPILTTTKAQLPETLAGLPLEARTWLEQTGFVAQNGQLGLFPDKAGRLAGAVVGLDEGTAAPLLALAALPQTLPAGSHWHLAETNRDTAEALALGWALGSYRFNRYLTETPRPLATLSLPKAARTDRVEAFAEAIYLVRDLINIPAADLGPEELADAGNKIARTYKAKTKIIRGEKLLTENYPSIYTVGQGSHRAPLLFDMRWGRKGAPKVTLVGKGIVFDTGGLNLKPGNSMLLMKKDMAGAAHALALGQLIMRMGLDVDLRVMCPIAENSIGERAMRPLDIIRTRSGKTVEVDNTDAEGRLVLSDCLTEASSEKPDVLLDFASLTGAAHVALGVGMGTMLSNNDDLAHALEAAAQKTHDPLWRLPLHQPYLKMLRAKAADITNSGGSGYAGAITAGLFLQQFVSACTPWAHFDIKSWNDASSPGKPEGGEAMCLRAVFAMLEEKYATTKPAKKKAS